MLIKKSLIAAGCALALLGAGCSGSASTSNQASEEAVVNAFLKAVQDKDRAEAEAYIKVGSELEGEFNEAWEEIGEMNLKSYNVLGTEGSEVKVEMVIEENGKTDSDTETIEVVEDGGKWWILEI